MNPFSSNAGQQLYARVFTAALQLLHSDFVLTVLLTALGVVFEFARQISKDTFMYWIYLAIELVFWIALVSVITHGLQTIFSATKTTLIT